MFITLHIENIGTDNLANYFNDEEFKKIDLNNPKIKILFALVNIIFWPIIVARVYKDYKDMDDFTKFR
jgi:hypothetical protein